MKIQVSQGEKVILATERKEGIGGKVEWFEGVRMRVMQLTKKSGVAESGLEVEKNLEEKTL